MQLQFPVLLFGAAYGSPRQIYHWDYSTCFREDEDNLNGLKRVGVKRSLDAVNRFRSGTSNRLTSDYACDYDYDYDHDHDYEDEVLRSSLEVLGSSRAIQHSTWSGTPGVPRANLIATAG